MFPEETSNRGSENASSFEYIWDKQKNNFFIYFCNIYIPIFIWFARINPLLTLILSGNISLFNQKKHRTKLNEHIAIIP